METQNITTLASEVTGDSAVKEATLGSSFSIPAPEDHEGWKTLYRSLGQPENADGYNFETQAVQKDEELEHWFKEAAFQSGLSVIQAQKLAEGWSTFNQEHATMQAASLQKQSEEALHHLQKEWGSSFNEKIEQAKRGVNHYGISAQELDALETALGTKQMLTLCARLGESFKEPTFIGKPKETAISNSQDVLKTLTQDKNFMAQYLNGNKEAVARITQLMKEAYA